MPAFIKPIGMLIFFMGILMGIYYMFPKEKQRVIKDKLKFEEDDDFQISEGGRFLHIFRPFFQLFLPITEKLPFPDYKSKIENYSITAGMEDEFTGNDFIAFQISMGILFSFMTFSLSKNMLFISIAGIIGLAYPYFWLYERRKERQKNIVTSMPDVVDMLSLSVAAGLDFNAAIKKICDIYRKDNDPFVAELYRMNKTMKVGKSREEALRDLAERVDALELYSFTSILIQAEKMGSGISDILKKQAVKMRQERFMKAEREGAIASQKLLVPMILFIFPIIFIVIFGPYILKYIYK